MSSHTRGPLGRGAGTLLRSRSALNTLLSVTATAILRSLGASRRGELHLLEGGAAHESVRIGERLLGLVVIVALAHPQLDRLAGRLHGRVEVAGLALELRRLEGAMGEDERGMQAVEVAL